MTEICRWRFLNMASWGQWTGEVLKTSQHTKTIHKVHKWKTNKGKLPFLDILLDRNTDKITTSVSRKPTHTGKYLHYTSYHPKSTKQAIVTSLQNRATVIYSNKDDLRKEYQQETLTLTAIGYPQNILTKKHTKTIFTQQKKKQTHQPVNFKISNCKIFNHT